MEERKRDHVRICLEEEVESGDAGFGAYRLRAESFPELALEDVDTTVEFLGKKLAFPFVISPMTGGLGEGRQLNRELAGAARSRRIGLALGSLRPAVEKEELLPEFDVRDVCPDAPLLGNIAAWQLRDDDFVGRLLKVMEALRFDGMYVHLNPSQELIQPEGERDFTGALDAVCRFAAWSPISVLVKEVGAGLNTVHLARLVDAGVAGVDVAGRGGTCFEKVEAQRQEDATARRLGEELTDWGVPTVEAIRNLRSQLDARLVEDVAPPVLIGSGGVRTARDMSVALALGADLVAAASPVLKAADKGRQALLEYLDYLHRGLKAYMLLTGSRNVSALRGKATSTASGGSVDLPCAP